MPLYDLFCKVTGFDGTPKRAADSASDIVLDRTIARPLRRQRRPGLPLELRAASSARSTSRSARTTLAFYKVTNTGDTADRRAPPPSTCRPDMAGAYFNKLECFCFTEQTLEPRPDGGHAGRRSSSTPRSSTIPTCRT